MEMNSNEKNLDVESVEMSSDAARCDGDSAKDLECSVGAKELEKETNLAKFLQFVKFALFSLVAGAIQLGACTLLNIPLKVPYWASYIIGLILSILYNFTINRRFTFKSTNNVPRAMVQVFLYYLVFTPISALWGAALTDGLFFGFKIMDGLGWNMFLVLIPTMIINMITEFIFCRLVVFRNSMNTRDKKAE